jgi:hypothetical protein
MSRGGTITAVVVASGVLIGGSIASVAAISSAVSPRSDDPAVVQAAIVQSPTALPPSPPAAETSVISASDLEITESDADLEVPDVSLPAPTQAPAAPQAAAAPAQPAPAQPAPKPSRTSTPRPGISQAAARAAVLKVAGGRVTSVASTRHGGYSAYAVKVTRNDGSVVIGYVDRTSGVVFDWLKVSGAPASPAAEPSSAEPSPTASQQSEDPKPPSPSASASARATTGGGGHDD